MGRVVHRRDGSWSNRPSRTCHWRGGPVPAQAQERLGPGGFSQSGAWLSRTPFVAEVGQEAVAGLSGAF